MKKSSILFALLLIFLSKLLPAQTGNEVSVSLLIPPPYSPYLSDYEGLLQNAIITLTNQTNNNLTLKLTGSMVGDNGFSAVTDANYLPSQAINLGPFQTRTIVADRPALAFFDPKNIDLRGNQQVVDNVLRTGILPEGTYEICVQAKDYVTNVPLSPDAPSGCTTIFIQWISPPLLSAPACDETVPLVQNTVTFAWLPVVTFPGRSNVVYDLYIVRVLLGQNPNDAIGAAINFRAGNPIVKEGLVASSYILTPADPPLLFGTTYAYAVVARDPMGRIVFENGGRSEVCVFHTMESMVPIGEIGQTGLDIHNFGPGLVLGNSSGAAPMVHLEGKLYYKFYGDGPAEAGSGFQMSQLNEVHAVSPFPTINNYNYQSGTDFTATGGAGWTIGTGYGTYQPSAPPMPSYLFNSVGKDGARPLKNMRVTFLATYLTGNKQNPQSEADFRTVGNGCEKQARGASLETPLEIRTDVLGTVWTNALGRFDFTGFTNGNTGTITTGKVTFSDGSSGDVCHATEGWGLYRVITMRIESPYYCNPDIVIFAQPYQSMQVPDLTVYVRSYNLEVTIIANNQSNQQANAGGPIRDAKVRIGRKTDLELAPDLPKNESHLEQHGQVDDLAGTAIDFTIYDSGNASQNGKFTFSRLVQHPGQGLDNSPPCPAPDNLYIADFKSDNNLGNLNYSATWSEIGPCQAALSITKPRNATFIPPTFSKTITLIPKFPEIYLQTRADYGNNNSSGNQQGIQNNNPDYSIGNLQPLPYVRTNLWIFSPNFPPVHYINYSDAGGLLRLRPFNNSFKHVNGAGVPDKDCQLDFETPGFRCKICPQGNKFLQWGERWTPTVIFEPKGRVKGEIVDEFGDAVMAQIRVADGPFVLTDMELYQSPIQNIHSVNWKLNLEVLAENNNSGGPSGELQLSEGNSQQMLPMRCVFECSAPTGNQIKVIIQPLESQYFADTIYVNIPEQAGNQPFNLGKLVVKQRLHRPRFEVATIKALDTGPFGEIETQVIAVPGASVTVRNEAPKNTNVYGYASFVFASPEEEEFHVTVTKDGFIPYDQYLIIPNSKDPYQIKITLEKAQTISGKVSDASSNQAISGARVYAHIGVNEFGNITVEAFTNAAGAYTLSGLPVGDQLIYAAKSGGDKTYLGEEKTVVLPINNPIDFKLKTAPFDMPNIWGIPVEIESASLISTGKYMVSGAFVNLPGNARFKAEDPQQRLPFEDLEVRLVGGNGQSGQPKAEPVANKVRSATLKTRALLNEHLLVELSGPVPGSNSPGESGYTYQVAPGLAAVMLHKITVEKQGNGKGAVMAKVFTQLEYMNFAHQYNGQFYLGETPNNPNMRVFQAGPGWTPQQSYHLFDYDFLNRQATNPAFMVHNFPAFSDRLNSYVRGDSFILATTLVVDLPTSNPDKIYVKGGKIIITPNNIFVIDGSQKIKFELETWKVELNNWSFSEAYGGIRGAGKIITNALTVPGDIIIRPNQLILPGTNNVDLSTLSLAGISTLQVQNPVNFILDYQGPGSIQHDPDQGHWRMQLTSNSGYVAAIKNLPGLTQDVKIGHIQNFSDGFIDMVLPPNQVLNHFNVITQTLENLYVHSDGFTLNGRINTGIPNMATGNSADFTYFKEAGQVKVRLAGLNADFETTGQIHFKGDPQIERIKLQNNLLEILGWATVYDDASAHTIRLRTKILKTPQSVKMAILQVSGNGETEGNNYQHIAMGGGSSKMKVLIGDQLVSGNSWQPLKFQAALDGFGGGFQDGKNKLWFVVDGAVTNDQSKGDKLTLTNIETPFGGLSLSFDFEDQALVGNMHVQNIPMGAMNILEGTLETRMSGQGFYLLCQMDALYPVIGQVRTNFIAGSYPSISPESRSLLTQGMHIKKLPAFLNNSGIQGLFVCANKPVLEVDFEIDLLVFGAGLYADAGVDARFWMNFGESYGGAHIGAMMYADIEAYVQVLVCEFCVGLNAELAADAEFQWTPSTNFSLNACGSIGVSANFCDVAEMKETVRLDLGWDSNGGFDLDVTLGESCSGMNNTSGSCVHF